MTVKAQGDGDSRSRRFAWAFTVAALLAGTIVGWARPAAADDMGRCNYVVDESWPEVAHNISEADCLGTYNGIWTEYGDDTAGSVDLRNCDALGEVCGLPMGVWEDNGSGAYTGYRDAGQWEVWAADANWGQIRMKAGSGAPTTGHTGMLCVRRSDGSYIAWGPTGSLVGTQVPTSVTGFGLFNGPVGDHYNIEYMYRPPPPGTIYPHPTPAVCAANDPGHPDPEWEPPATTTTTTTTTVPPGGTTTTTTTTTVPGGTTTTTTPGSTTTTTRPPNGTFACYTFDGEWLSSITTEEACDGVGGTWTSSPPDGDEDGCFGGIGFNPFSWVPALVRGTQCMLMDLLTELLVPDAADVTAIVSSFRSDMEESAAGVVVFLPETVSIFERFNEGLDAEDGHCGTQLGSVENPHLAFLDITCVGEDDPEMLQSMAEKTYLGISLMAGIGTAFAAFRFVSKAVNLDMELYAWGPDAK